MTTRSLYRFSAVLGILSGLCIILGKLLIPIPNRQIGEIIDFFSPFFALLFVVGMALRQRKEARKFGGIASIILFFGLAAVVSLDFIGAFILHTAHDLGKEGIKNIGDQQRDGTDRVRLLGTMRHVVIAQFCRRTQHLFAHIFTNWSRIIENPRDRRGRNTGSSRYFTNAGLRLFW